MKRVLLWGVVVLIMRRLIPRSLQQSPLLVAARHPWITLAVVAFAVGIGGLAVAASGLVSMKASTGHWPITARFLHFAMRQSVLTHAVGITPPALDDPALVLRGAAHYDLACRACHGGAAGRVPVIPAGIVPPPRPLARHAADWRSRELFYIVKHGMKFTGMPAWPAQRRDDEVWAIVAFLRVLPSLGEAEYDRLVRGRAVAEPLDLVSDLPAPEVVAENCSRCHGVDGSGRGTGAFPRLAGQRAEYLDGALRAYATGQRHSGIMQPIAAALTTDARLQAVSYYASLAPAAASPVPTSADGRTIATRGAPDRLIPPCAECHGPARAPKNPAFPRLAGQYARYLEEQLRLLRSGARGGSDYVHLMHAFAGQLTDEQISAAAAYYASVTE